MARCNGRPTVESCITLDLQQLKGAGFVPGAMRFGDLQWTWPHSKLPACKIRFLAMFEGVAGTLHLTSITYLHRSGVPVHLEGQTIQLATTVPPYGGRRWWFLCPSTGRRVLKLYLPSGANAFASRQAYRLGYSVQREGALEQARRRTRKARKRIGGGPNLTERLPLKPKWMRWATYWRHVKACHKAEVMMLPLFASDAEKLLGRRITP
jgi:hypothetical protein